MDKLNNYKFSKFVKVELSSDLYLLSSGRKINDNFPLNHKNDRV